MENEILSYYVSLDGRHTVTRYSDNSVELCYCTPTGRQATVQQQSFSTEMGAILFFEYKKDEMDA